MTNDDTVFRLSNAINNIFRDAEATGGDVFQSLVHVQLTSIVAVAKDEDEAVEHAAKIGEYLQQNIRTYFKQHQTGELGGTLQ